MTNEKKEKNTFWPRICIWVENEHKKVKFALRSTKNPQRCQISKKFKSLPKFCTNLRGTFGDLRGTGCTFPEPSGKLRGTFGQASGSHLAASRTFCGRFSQNISFCGHFAADLRQKCHFLGGGALAVNFFDFFRFWQILGFFWEKLHVGGVCVVTFAPSFGNSGQCVCIYICVCVCLCVFVEKMKQQSNKKEKSYYTF